TYAEPGLEPPDRVAEPRGAAARKPSPFAEPFGAGHRDEGVEIAEISVHCSCLRTACADCNGLSCGSSGLNSATSNKEKDHGEYREIRRLASRRPCGEAAWLRRDAARRQGCLRPAKGSRRGDRRPARGNSG